MFGRLRYDYFAGLVQELFLQWALGMFWCQVMTWVAAIAAIAVDYGVRGLQL